MLKSLLWTLTLGTQNQVVFHSAVLQLFLKIEIGSKDVSRSGVSLVRMSAREWYRLE